MSSLHEVMIQVNDSPESRRASGRPRRIGAFFDMDKTLISENSGSIYMKHRYAEGEIDTLTLLKAFGAYLQYKMGVLDLVVDFFGTSQRIADMHGRNLPTPKRIRSWCSYGSWRVHWVQRKSIHILDDNDDSHSSDSLFHSHFYRVQAPQHCPSSVHHLPNSFDFRLK